MEVLIGIVLVVGLGYWIYLCVRDELEAKQTKSDLAAAQEKIAALEEKNALLQQMTAVRRAE